MPLETLDDQAVAEFEPDDEISGKVDEQVDEDDDGFGEDEPKAVVTSAPTHNVDREEAARLRREKEEAHREIATLKKQEAEAKKEAIGAHVSRYENDIQKADQEISYLTNQLIKAKEEGNYKLEVETQNLIQDRRAFVYEARGIVNKLKPMLNGTQANAQPVATESVKDAPEVIYGREWLEENAWFNDSSQPERKAYAAKMADELTSKYSTNTRKFWNALDKAMEDFDSTQKGSRKMNKSAPAAPVSNSSNANTSSRKDRYSPDTVKKVKLAMDKEGFDYKDDKKFKHFLNNWGPYFEKGGRIFIGGNG